MLTAKVFQSGNSQAIRIPNEYRTEHKEFYIRQFDGCLYLIPTTDPWSLLKNCLGQAASEPEIERDQPMLSDLPQREKF